MLKLVEEDKLLKPFAGIIEKRHQQVLAMEREFTYRTTRLSDSCNSYLYYGLHRTNEGVSRMGAECHGNLFVRRV